MPTSDPWDGTTWDVTAPDTDQPAGNAFKEIFDLRKGIALRINKEHETLATSSAGGVHKQGSARAFFQDAAPATQVDTSAFDSGDLGLFWVDSNSTIDNELSILTVTTPTWTPVSVNIIATLLASNRVYAGTLGVDGLLTADGGVTLGAGADLIGSATSDIAINTNKFNVAGATGNTNVGGTFESVGVATLADASVTKTTAAPGADAQLANKKYVDDQIAAIASTALSAATREDSESNNMVESHAYLATSDGEVTALVSAAAGGKELTGYIDNTDDPVGAGDIIQKTSDNTSAGWFSIEFLVASGEYFEITSTAAAAATIRWRSFGTLSKPVDQD